MNKEHIFVGKNIKFDGDDAVIEKVYPFNILSNNLIEEIVKLDAPEQWEAYEEEFSYGDLAAEWNDWIKRYNGAMVLVNTEYGRIINIYPGELMGD